MKKLDFLKVVSLTLVFIVGVLCAGFARGADGFNAITSVTSSGAHTSASGWVCENANVSVGDSSDLDVATPIFTPVAGFYYNMQTVAIATSTADAIIYYTTDGTTPDATSAVYSSPITVSTNATIKAIAILGEEESYVATANFSFPTVENSVSALKADGVNNEIYRLNAALRVIYQNGQYLFVQDGTGALLIYGNAGKTYEEGDYIYNGIYGQFSMYNGMKELSIVADAPEMADGEAGQAINPIVVTIADLVENYDQYESKLVTIKGVTFTGDNNFAQGDDAISFYNRFNTFFSITAGSLGNVTGLVAKSDNDIQIYPRSNKDIEVAAELPLIVDFDENTADGWLIDNGDCVNEWYIGQTQGFDNNKLYISATNGSTNKYNNAVSDVTFSRLINVPASGAVLTFDCRVNGENNYDYVSVKLDDEIIGTYHSIVEWTTQSFNIAPEMAGAHTLTFEWQNDASIANQFAAAIDNINIVPVTCTQPVNLTATVNGTTANIAWTAPADQNAWTVEYKLSNHTEWYSMDVTTPSITLSDLQGNSTYNVRVKANCGDDNSLWTNGTFNVECQNLDVTVASEDVTIGTGTSTQTYLFDGLYGFGYSANLYTMENTGVINSVAFNISSANTTTGASVDMWVKAVPANYALSSSNTFNQMLTDAQQIASGVSDFSAAGWKVFNINGGFELGEGQNLLVLTRSRGCSPSGGCSKSVYYTSTTNKVWYKRADSNDPGQSVSGTLSSYLPNIKINMDVVTTICGDVEACPAVTDVTISNVTPQGAELAWDAEASQNAFIVEYKTAGASVWNTINVNDANSVVLSGLMQLTDYVVKVKANCGTNNLSEPVVATFATTGICPIVSNIEHANNSNVTTLTWTAGGSESAWIIQFKPVAAADDAWVTINASIIPMTTFGGLQGSTDYEVRIKAICDPDDTENQSAWVYYNFLSGCAAYDVPFAETFSSSNEPDCWSSNGFGFDGYQATANGVDSWLMTPAINIPSGNTNYFISFNMVAMGDYTLLASDRGSALARFTTLYNGTSADGRVIVAIPESYKGKMVYFMLSNNGQSFVSVDNFKITECPYVPTNVHSTAVTINSITLAWDSNEYVSSWNVEYKTGSGEWNTVTANTNPFVLTGLEGSTNYQIRMQSACSQNASSDYSSIITVTTACPAQSLPFVEDFEASEFGTCWSQISESGSMAWTIYSGAGSSNSSAASGSKNAYFVGNNSSGSTTKLVSPAIDLSTVGSAQIIFSHVHKNWSGDQNVLNVYFRENESSQWTLLGTYNNDLSSWARETIVLNSHSATVQFAFEGISNYGYPIGLDNIVVEAAPSCFTPTNLAVGNVNSNSAEISWTGNNNQNTYVVAYRPVGQADWNTVNVESGHSTTLIGLAETTPYEVMAKTVCSPTEESEYTDVITFTTICSNVWHAEIGNGTTGSSYFPSHSYYNNSLTQQIYDASEIGTAGSIIEISFYNKGSAKTRTYDIYLKHTSKSTFSTATDWIPVSSSDKVFSGSVTMNANEWTTITLDNTFEFNGSDNVVLVFDDNTGSYSSGLSGRCTSQSPNYKSLYIYSDGVNYNPSSPSSYSGTRTYDRLNVIFSGCGQSCSVPRNVSVGDIAFTTAEVSWTVGGEETEWNVQYGPTGFALGTGTTIFAISNPITLTDLTPSTAYDVYVQADCGGGEVSIWSAVSSFVTDCDIVTSFPFVEDFEGAFLPTCWTSEYVSGPGNKNWNSTTSYVHSGSHAAYIPDQNATTIHNLVTPQLSISQANAYELSFWMYRNTDYSSKANEGVRVFVNTIPSAEGATELMYIHRNYGNSPVETTSGWHEYKAVIPTSGNLYVIFQGINEYGGASYIDDISVIKFPNSDLAVTSISHPNEACDINEALTVDIQNLGLNDASTFDAYYSLNGGTEIHEVVNLSTPLAYRASTTYTFNAVPVYQLGSNVVNVRVEISGDENAFNDIISTTVAVLAPQDVPYFENFSGVTVNHGWNSVDANNDGITMGINNAITYSFNDAMAADDWMFSPCLNLPAGTYNVSFDYAGNSSLEESFSLWYGAAANIVNMTNLVANQTVNSTATNNYTGTIVVAQDGVYNFGFHAQSAAGNLGFSIDNFSVTPMVEVNVIAGNNGSVSPAGNVSVGYNDNLVITIVPDEMYHVGGIWVDGVQVMNEDPFNANFMLYTLENVTTPHTVNVEFKLEFHIIKSVENINPAYTDVPGYFIPAATDTLIDPNPFTVTFAPAPHYHFATLELGAMSLDNPTDVSENVIDNGNGTYSYVIDTLVVANYYVNAIFERDSVNIHYNILTGQGTVDASPNLVAPAQYDTWVDYDVMNDLTETMTIVPAPNYHIVDVNVNGEDMGAINTYSFTNIHETQNVAVKFGYQVTASIRNYVNEYLGSNDVRGIIAPATQLVPEFDPMTVTGTIENHFHLYNFFVNGVDRIDEVVFDGNNFSFTIPSVEDNYDIEAVVKIDTFGIHYTIVGGDGTVDGHDVVAGSNLVTMLNYGDSFLSTIEPAPGYHIESVTIDGVNYGNINTWRYEFISGHHYVTVVYAPNTIVINTTAYGVGTVTPGETFLYDPAHTYTFTATPAEGYHIESLLHNDENVVIADPEAAYTETLTNIVENHTYVALFAMNTYNIAATAGANGTVSPAGVTTYNYGANTTYYINAENGYYISSVTVDGNTVNYTQADALNNTTISFSNITEGHTVAATFAQYEYTITVNAGANGVITPGTTVYAFGSTPSFDITPNAGYGIVDVTVDGASVGAVDSYTFTALEANHTIAATFAQHEYTITATAGSNGTITPSGVTNMIYNGNQTYSIAAAAGYHIQDVFVDGVSVGAVTSYSFTGVTANHTIHAMFAANEYTITVNQPAHGTITPGTITVTYGATPTFVITPAIGYSVATITLNGTNVINAATNVNGVYTYTLPAVSANATLTATMNAITYTINATAGANGTIAPAGVSTVNFGANKAYTITPANGYVVDQVTVDGINMGAIGAYTFVNVVANHTIHATFKYAECEVPTNLHVINVDTTSATLTWYHPGANSFDIQYKALDAATYTIIGSVTGNSYDLTDLQPNTSYVWNITANCAAGNHSETSNGNIFTTLALPVPAPIDTTGVENYVQNLIKVYGVVNNIYVVNNNNVNISNIQVYDIYGQLLYNGQANSNPEVISMNVAAGTYMVRIATDKGICNYKLYLRK